jgi:hypothetical protein
MRPSERWRYGSLILLLLLAITGRAQYLERQVIAATGTYAAVGNLKLEYTLGDLVVNTTLASAAPFTQGFHQAPRLDDTQMMPAPAAGSPTAWPNPTADAVRIEWGSTAKGMATVDLYDALGQRLRSDRANLSLAYACDLTPFAVGAYFIRCAPEVGKVMTILVQKAR